MIIILLYGKLQINMVIVGSDDNFQDVISSKFGF